MKPLSGKDQRRFLSISNVQFQKEFVLLIVFAVMSSMGIMLAGTFFMIQKFSLLSAGMAPAGTSFEAEIHDQLRLIWIFMFGAAIIDFICIAIIAFWFSKRASGIVYRLTKDLNRLADGDAVPKIVPREGDFFLDLVAAANRLIEKK
jgi:hypothetical protein